MRQASLLFLLLYTFTASAQDIFLKGYALCKLHDTSTVVMDTSVNKDPGLRSFFIDHKVKYCTQPFLGYGSLEPIYKVEYDPGMNADSLVAALSKLPYVETAEKMPVFQIFDTPDDLNPVKQYSLIKIEAPQAWDITTGSSDVVVAVIDNATNVMHEDLSPNIWKNANEIPGNSIDDDDNGYVDDINGYDVAENDNNPSPPASATDTSAWIHGSHCAGIVSAATDNGVGIASLGRNLSLMVIKCTPDSAKGNILPGAFDGMIYALRAGADVLSMSFGTEQRSNIIQQIIDQAHANGVVMVAAAGNENTETLSYPAAYNHVIAVAATDLNDKRAGFSNYGSWVDVSAPGVQIQSTFAATSSSYGALSGTSMATPLVAALAGLVLSENPDATPDQVETLIKNGCDNIDALNPSFAGKLGAGRINAYKTLQNFTHINKTTDMSSKTIKAFPNPVTSEHGTILNFTGMSEGANYIDIYDLQGKLIYSTVAHVKEPGSAESIALQNAVKGIYLLQVTHNRNIVRRKIVLN